jgi:protein arginine N-methyltransferase 1
VYSVAAYGAMIADRVRTDAYAEALRRAVRPGAVVLDVGAGTGIFALLACRCGARRVYAVEPDDAIEVARETAAANGLSGRITFYQELSTRVNLPERADVIVSDLRGVLPLCRHHLPAVADARRRFLAPGGRLIPRRDTLWAGVAEAPELYGQCTGAWEDRRFGLDLGAARRLATNTWRRARLTADQLLAGPGCWATLDYETLESPDVGGSVTWAVERAGTGHGLAVWFDAELAEGVGFSNAPGAPELIYGAAFFPWPAPVALGAGDTVSASLRADLVGKDYVWRWDSRVTGPGSPGPVKADFKQSTFFGAPLSPATLRRRAAEYVPALDEDGQLDRLILTLMDGATPLGEIARRVADRFPDRFPRWQDALTRAGDLAQRYGR